MTWGFLWWFFFLIFKNYTVRLHNHTGHMTVRSLYVAQRFQTFKKQNEQFGTMDNNQQKVPNIFFCKN